MSKRFSGLLSLLLAALCLFTACSGDPGQPGSDTATSAALPSRPGTASSTSQNGSSPAGSSSGGDSSCPHNATSSSGTSHESETSSESATRPDSSGSQTSSGHTSASGCASSVQSSASSSHTASSQTSSSAPPPVNSKPTSSAASKPAPKPTTPPTKPGYQGTITVKTPVASGKVVYEGNGATIDASNASEGYVMVKCISSAPRLKLQIKFSGQTYNYDLNKDGRYVVFNLPGGSGDYQIRVMENVSGTRYRQLFAATLNVKLSSEFSPFLYPNQYVNFSASSKAVKKSYDLCVGANTDLKKIEAIYTYITQSIAYDYDKADDAKAGKLNGYLPDVDDTLKSGKGICFDYAALMAAMLRAQNIPVKLVTGNVSPNDLSHAWNLVYTREKGWIAFKIYFSGGSWKLMDATFGAAEGQNIEDYIGNGSKYTQLRVY